MTWWKDCKGILNMVCGLKEVCSFNVDKGICGLLELVFWSRIGGRIICIGVCGGEEY